VEQNLETQSTTPADTTTNPPRSKTLGERVLDATIVIVIAHIIAKAMGLLQARVIGHYHGFDTVNDAFILVSEGLIYTLFLVGEESLGPAFLPVFMAAKEKDSESAAWRFASTIWNLQLALLLSITALLMLFPEHAVSFFTRFNKGSAAEKLARSTLAIHFLTAMAPSLIGISLGSLTYVIMNGYKKFFWPAFADAALKCATVVGVVAGHQMGLNEDALVIGVLAAGFTKIAVHLIALGKRVTLYRPVLSLSDPHIRKFTILLVPLLVGIIFAKSRDYFNNFYIISSLEEGMLSVNSYGRKIYSAVGWLIPYPLSIAMFPFFCELVARDDRNALGDFLTRASRMLMLIFLPLTVVVVVLSVPLAQALFETGKVSAEDAALAGRVNAFYSAVMPFYALEAIYMQAYFSTHRTISVTVIGIIFSSLSMLISYLGVVTYGLKGPDAVVLVALGFTVSRALKSIALASLLKARGLPLLPLGPTLSFLARASLLSAACGMAAYGTLKGVEKVQGPRRVALDKAPDKMPVDAKALNEKKGDELPAKRGEIVPKESEPQQPGDNKARKPASGLKALLRAAPQLALPGLAALLVFVAGCFLLRLSELNEMILFTKLFTKEKLRRRGKKKPEPTRPAA